MSSVTNEKIKNYNKKSSNANKILAIGASVVALAAVGKMSLDRIEAGNELSEARQELSTINSPKREVNLDADTTIFAIASAAVKNGYLKGVDPREASDFLTTELNNQMHEKGLLSEGESIDLGKLQPGTILELPASWEKIGKEVPVAEIGTAISAESDGNGNVIVKESDQSGNTTTTVESEG